MADKKGGNKFILGALIGAAIGAAAGLLTAPKSGAETRDDLAKKGKKALRDGKAAGEKVVDKAKSEIDQLKNS